MKLSQLYADFNAEVNESVPFMIANATLLKLIPAQVTILTNDLTDQNVKYPLYTAAATHNEITIHDVANLFHNFGHYINGIKKTIKSDSSIVLTETQITTLHLHIDQHRRGHVDVPNIAPNNSIQKQTHLVASIFTFNPTTGHETDRGKPDDVNKMGRKIAFVAAGAPAPTIDLYHTMESIGTTLYDIVFDLANDGADAYLITWYINERGEEGPPSPPIKIHVS